MPISRFKPAFTLIELLTVITIMAIIVGFGAYYFTGAQTKARDEKRKTDLKNIKSALQLYYEETSYFPVAFGGRITCNHSPFSALLINWDTEFYCTETSSGSTVTFMEKLPVDPKGWTFNQKGYRYDTPEFTGPSALVPRSFVLSATLESTSDPDYCDPENEDCVAKIGCNPTPVSGTYKRTYCVRSD